MYEVHRPTQYSDHKDGGNMPGNSKRRGAVRRRQGGNPTAGSGGRVRRGLKGKGPTPKAQERTSHPAKKVADAQLRAQSRRPKATGPRVSGGAAGGGRAPGRRGGPDGGPEWVVGRNAVVESLRAGVPVLTLHVAERIDRDDRVREVLRLAMSRQVSMLEVPRTELDRLTSGAVHQGLALCVPPYEYAHPDDLLAAARERGEAPLVVALDGVTDPRNLGAVIRSGAAFGAHGVVVPERRSASMTAAAQKSSAGAAVRVPVARAVNLTRALRSYRDAGLTVVGLDVDGEQPLAGFEDAADPLVLVIGSEGKGLSRLVRETCDRLVRIPMSAETESLNAGVAAGIALYEIAGGRRSRPSPVP